ncbi:MAG: DUF1684 domain-containing protein [Dehalococcoidia bacterium]|nr:DUF1684 domain-containing protein [Dehalococcoidia bacterium]MCB9487013.1 DUF1684 domain-containing protein [Thermoflexaceae bacterium]
MSELTGFRREKDAFFRENPQSPLLPAQRTGFTGLRYYDEDPSLVVDAVPEPFSEPEVVTMQTSTGDEQQYLRWAIVHFEIEGTPVSLTIYRDPNGGYFIPFTDAGRGVETYGAGRYLEPEVHDDGSLVLDFNYAYNPYCAYNDVWSCPLPPAENHLKVRVPAGEMVFHG